MEYWEKKSCSVVLRSFSGSVHSLDIWQINQTLWCCWDNPCKFGLDTDIWEKKNNQNQPLLSYSCCILTNSDLLHRPCRDGSSRRFSAIWALPGGWHWGPALQAEWLPLMCFSDHQLAPDSKKKKLPRRQHGRQPENKSPSGRVFVYNFCKYYTRTYIHSYTVRSPINTSYQFFWQSTDVSLTCLNQNLLTEILWRAYVTKLSSPCSAFDEPKMLNSNMNPVWIQSKLSFRHTSPETY